MISVIIPTYNCNTNNLVERLHSQLKNYGIIHEIIVVNDASSFDIEIGKYAKTIVNPKNMGRSAARNIGAKHAKFDYLLFIDCGLDIDYNFIKNYIDNINKADIVCGGVGVRQKNKNVCLREKYILKREQISASERNKYPYKSFKSANFLIKKSIFHKIRFDEEITGYGHEDTLFGFKIKILKINILHIENPVWHTDFDDNDTYLRKTAQAVRNIKLIYDKYPDIASEVRLLRYFFILKKYKLIFLLYFVGTNFLRMMIKKTNNIFLLDFYKLKLLSEYYF